MTPHVDPELELRAGMVAATKHDYDTAIAAFERALAADPQLWDAKLNLLNAYIATDRLAAADAIAAAALPEHGTDSAFLELFATLREHQGRYDEALDLIHNRYVDLRASSRAYPKYLRILVGALHWSEAVLAAREALEQPSLWTPHARLARILSLLHFKEDALARAELPLFDSARYSGLIENWAKVFERSGAIGAIRELLKSSSLAAEPAVAALRARFGS